MAAFAPCTTGEEIALRAEGGWPLDGVLYSMSRVWNDDDGRTDEDGYRCDCSGFHAMCQGLAAPGPSTVGLVDHCHRIDWSQIERGDFVMLGGPGTGGAAGHTSVIVRVDRAANTYTILHQSGGYGPDRWTGRIGTVVRAGMVPYRSNYITKGSMSMLCKKGDKGVAVGALQHLILDAGGTLPRWGADEDYGDETAGALAALVGGDGSIYGPSQYSDLMVRLAKRYGGASPAPDLTALTGRVTTIETDLKTVKADLQLLAANVGRTITSTVNAAVAGILDRMRGALGG